MPWAWGVLSAECQGGKAGPPRVGPAGSWRGPPRWLQCGWTAVRGFVLSFCDKYLRRCCHSHRRMASLPHGSWVPTAFEGKTDSAWYGVWAGRGPRAARHSGRNARRPLYQGGAGACTRVASESLSSGSSHLPLTERASATRTRKSPGSESLGGFRSSSWWGARGHSNVAS